MKVISSENPRMSVLSDEKARTLEDTIRVFDRNLGIAEIDYQTGTIHVGITYNRGTDGEWTNDRFLSINVNCDSVSAIFWDVIRATHDRCA